MEKGSWLIWGCPRGFRKRLEIFLPTCLNCLAPCPLATPISFDFSGLPPLLPPPLYLGKRLQKVLSATGPLTLASRPQALVLGVSPWTPHRPSPLTVEIFTLTKLARTDFVDAIGFCAAPSFCLLNESQRWEVGSPQKMWGCSPLQRPGLCCEDPWRMIPPYTHTHTYTLTVLVLKISARVLSS